VVTTEAALLDLETPVLDESRLMEEFGNDPEVLAELRELFLEHLPPLMEEIKEAVKIGDSGVVTRNAHSLKGASSTFGAMRIAQVSRSLELLARDGCLVDAGDLVALLETELERAFERIRQLCTRA
jgi:HPt (histidine-containing phosphotransfer) domain-containing protein